MSASVRSRFVNPRLGTFFGIYASLFVSLFLLLLIFSQLGAHESALRFIVLIGPVGLYGVFAFASFTADPFEFFASGRRVPAVYNGLVLAGAVSGGTMLVSLTGLWFLNGYDTWCIAMGAVSGFVCMATLIAPYLRKFGAFTVPTFLGRRLESFSVRVISAALFAVPMLLILVAELRMGVWIARVMTGSSQELLLSAISLAILAGVAVGGMRAVTWSGTAQMIAVLITTIVLAGIVGVLLTNLPLPQLSSGPILRNIGRMEGAFSVAIPKAPLLAFEFAGQELSAIVGRIAEPFEQVGMVSFVTAILVTMMGVAAAPWLVPRCTTTTGVYGARKSLGWSVFFFGLLVVTTSSVAVLLRHYALDELVGQSRDNLPDWFGVMQNAGYAQVVANVPQLPLEAFAFKRDALLFMLPSAAGLSNILGYFMLAGALAAVFIAASNTAHAFGAIVAEDIIGGLRWTPSGRVARLLVARLSIAGVVVLGAIAAGLLSSDPFALVLSALFISAATAFPALVLAIWWQRCTKHGALAALVTGFALSVAATVILPSQWAAVANPTVILACVIVSAIVGVVVSKLTVLPSRVAIERLREMRIPSGETIYDRETRLLRLRQREGGPIV